MFGWAMYKQSNEPSVQRVSPVSKTRVGILFALWVGLAGCGVNRYVMDPYDTVKLELSRAVNPDKAGRPSPVAIKIYELSTRTTFDNLDFEGATYNATTFLSDELLSEQSYILQPGEKLEYKIKLARTARYIAIVAGFRAIDSAKWKLVYPVNSNWYGSHEVLVTADEVILKNKKNNDSDDEPTKHEKKPAEKAEKKPAEPNKAGEYADKAADKVESGAEERGEEAVDEAIGKQTDKVFESAF